MRSRSYSVCPICNKEISNSNIKKHLISHEKHPEYHELSRYALTHDGLSCQYCGKECKNKNSLCNHERLCSKNPLKQKSNLSNYSQIGRTAWNKGLTIDDPRVRKNGDSVRRFYKINSSSRLGKSLPEETRLKISKTIQEKVANGEWHVSLAKNMHYSYKGQDLHGTWELRYAQYLDKQGIQWKRNKKRFLYYFEGKKHYYTPDFYLIENNTFIEIKGFKTDKDEAKWSYFPETEKLQVLFYEDLIDLGIDVQN